MSHSHKISQFSKPTTVAVGNFVALVVLRTTGVVRWLGWPHSGHDRSHCHGLVNCPLDNSHHYGRRIAPTSNPQATKSLLVATRLWVALVTTTGCHSAGELPLAIHLEALLTLPVTLCHDAGKCLANASLVNYASNSPRSVIDVVNDVVNDDAGDA